MLTLKKNFLVTKRNALNEIRASNMTLQELRFFCIYLSKINAKDTSTRLVRFSLADFCSIMEIDRRIKVGYMKRVTNSLLCKVVNIPDERGGYTGFQIFKKCKIYLGEDDEWYIEIDAHDDALPMMFEYKEKFFSYQLCNVLRLRSSNQLRMYEILKQYEHIGSRVLAIDELKELIGIGKDEYPLFNNLKQWVLNSCQQALAANSDITFTYEPYGKRGRGGKIFFLKFTIQKNENYNGQLTLDEFIFQDQGEADYDRSQSEEAEKTPYDEKMVFLAEACSNEFSIREIIVLHDLMVELLPYQTVRDQLRCYDYLTQKYRYMNMRDEKTPISNRFSYIKSIIGKDNLQHAENS